MIGKVDFVVALMNAAYVSIDIMACVLFASCAVIHRVGAIERSGGNQCI